MEYHTIRLSSGCQCCIISISVIKPLAMQNAASKVDIVQINAYTGQEYLPHVVSGKTGQSFVLLSKQ